MQLHKAPFLGSSIWDKIGGATMGVVRSGVGLFTQARGDSANQVVEGPAQTNYANLAVYGTLAAIAMVLVVKPTRSAKSQYERMMKRRSR